NVPHRLQRLGQHCPPLVVEQPRRDDNLIEDKPFPLITMRAELLLVTAGGEVEQPRLARVPGHGGAVPRRVQVVYYTFILGSVVEVAADEEVNITVGQE